VELFIEEGREVPRFLDNEGEVKSSVGVKGGVIGSEKTGEDSEQKGPLVGIGCVESGPVELEYFGIVVMVVPVSDCMAEGEAQGLLVVSELSRCSNSSGHSGGVIGICVAGVDTVNVSFGSNTEGAVDAAFAPHLIFGIFGSFWRSSRVSQLCSDDRGPIATI
jgi:hypothetical protein